jgi:hypothetical protein
VIPRSAVTDSSRPGALPRSSAPTPRSTGGARHASTLLLWRLLDPNGASARWRIERPLRRSDQPAGAVVTTSVQTSEGPIVCRDGIVPIDDAVALVRLVRSFDSPCRATHELVASGR